MLRDCRWSRRRGSEKFVWAATVSERAAPPLHWDTCCCLHWADPALFIETAVHAFGCTTENEFETEGPLVFGVITFSENGPILAPTTLYESKQTVGYMAIKYSWLALSGNSI